MTFEESPQGGGWTQMDAIDLDTPIPAAEATRAVADCLLFAASAGSHLAVVRAEADGPDALVITLARESNEVLGVPRRFRVTLQALEGQP